MELSLMNIYMGVMKMNQKFSASEWKDAVEKDLTEIKAALFDIYNFIRVFEQWRSLPFNNQKEAANANSKEQSSKERDNSRELSRTNSSRKARSRKSKNKTKRTGATP